MRENYFYIDGKSKIKSSPNQDFLFGFVVSWDSDFLRWIFLARRFSVRVRVASPPSGRRRGYVSKKN
jgi:hypothetical protein